jgi:hypothetical protein
LANNLSFLLLLSISVIAFDKEVRSLLTSFLQISL